MAGFPENMCELLQLGHTCHVFYLSPHDRHISVTLVAPVNALSDYINNTPFRQRGLIRK